jgi:hypothetical protein
LRELRKLNCDLERMREARRRDLDDPEAIP